MLNQALSNALDGVGYLAWRNGGDLCKVRHGICGKKRMQY